MLLIALLAIQACSDDGASSPSSAETFEECLDERGDLAADAPSFGEADATVYPEADLLSASLRRSGDSVEVIWEVREGLPDQPDLGERSNAYWFELKSGGRKLYSVGAVLWDGRWSLRVIDWSGDGTREPEGAPTVDHNRIVATYSDLSVDDVDSWTAIAEADPVMDRRSTVSLLSDVCEYSTQ